MRVVGTIPFPHFKVTIFSLDASWYVECEAGPMKQGYKFPKEKIADQQALQLLLNEKFLEKVRQHFNAMYTDFLPLVKGS